MPDFSKRSHDFEVMDDLNCSGDVVAQTLHELDVINHWLGGNEVTFDGIDSLLKKNYRKSELYIADLGCGSGEILKLLARKFRNSNTKSLFTGFDANSNIAAYAAKHVSEFPEISIQSIDILDSEFRVKKFDVVLATLFFHHFTTNQLITLLQNLKEQTTLGIVINDLHRHWLAYYSIKLLTSFFSKSSMVKNDAPLSVLRGFNLNELKFILAQAGISTYSLKWKWAFRWQLVIPSQQQKGFDCT